MTCEDVKTQIENAKASETESWSEPRLAAHIASCAQCSHLVRDRQSLGKGLKLVRESLPPVSESLNATVLAGYRRFIAGRKVTSGQGVRQAYFPLLLRWGAITAFVLIAATIALYFTRKPVKTSVPPPTQASLTASAAIPSSRVESPQVQPAKRLALPARKNTGRSGLRPATRILASMPDDFRGLMYCDELSCDGAMDMVRVQLPASVLARPTSVFHPASANVNADVLIGPDGIARGIRIEGREF